MTAILVDSNVLLDIMSGDAAWFGWSAEAIESAAARSRLVINVLIYAEVSVRFSKIEDLDAAMPRTMFDREAVRYEAGYIAGKTFQNYPSAAARSARRLPISLSARTQRQPATNF
jgi:predicted nucleic acid-binding protein